MKSKSLALAPIHIATSKTAQRAYLGTFLFVTTTLILVAVSTLAYGIFYYSFVPQIGIEREVHLQFGYVLVDHRRNYSISRGLTDLRSDGNPHGSAVIGSDLVPMQAYDVKVKLYLPRTPANIHAGNFMVDLTLDSPPSSTLLAGNSSTRVIAHSRRPTILTYASPFVDTATRIWHMPGYVLGLWREAEALEIRMMDRIEFAKGWKNVPSTLRLELQSREHLQVYSTKVEFVARFSGLRYVYIHQGRDELLLIISGG